MFRSRLYGVLLLQLVLCCTGYNVACQPFSVQKYTANDGLADSYILQVFQDSEGFIWAGTVNGVSRFDGREFINYGYAAGLPNLYARCYEDRDKRMWVCTRNSVVEMKGGRCISYPLDDHQPVTFVFGLKESQHDELWCFTNKGMYQFDGRQWKKVKLYPGMENRACRSAIETGGGLLINYGDYLVFRNAQGAYNIWQQHLSNYPWFERLTLFDSQLYLGSPGGLFLLQDSVNTPLFKKVLHNKSLGSYFRDSGGRFWFSTEEDGLLVAKKGSVQDIADTIPLGVNLVSNIYEDRDGNIWLACLEGLLKLREVKYELFGLRRNPSLTGIRNLVKTPGNALLAYTTSGLQEYKKGGFHPLPGVAAGGGPVGPDVVDGWCSDDRQRVWLATRFGKLWLLENNTVKDVSGLAGKQKNYWSAAFNARNNKIYLCADTLMSGDDHGITVFHSAHTGQSIAWPRTVHCFADGYMLVNTNRNELLLIDAAGNTQDISGTMGIVKTSPLQFYEAPSGKCWLYYNGGLIRFHWDSRHLPVKELSITAKDGLPNEAIHCITTDALNRLWVITSAGLVVIETDTAGIGKPVVHRLSEEMGISYNLWIEARILTDAEGKIWMSFLDGIYRFDPLLIQFDNKAPRVSIEDIQLNLQPIDWRKWTDSLYGYRQLPRQAALPWWLDNLSVSYKAPCFSGSSGIEYSYHLEGADSGWSAPSRNSSVSFVKLPPGSYRFMVRARKSNTDWGEPAVFIFSIQKPWWQTWWFRLAVVVLLALALAFFVHKRIQRIRRKALVREQLQELEFKALRLQMNPHFIYNALNSIQALVLDNRAEEASRYISKFGRLLRQVLNHSEKTVISLKEELEALALYLELENLRLNFELQYDINIDPAINTSDEQLPPLVLQPFAENAVWHGLSRKQGEKRLHISLSLDAGWLLVDITDEGVGRSHKTGAEKGEAAHPSKGMDITGRRIHEYNHAPGIIAVTVTDLYDAHQQPAGTKVVLYIKRKQ